MVYSQQTKLIDIKPVYKSYSLAAIVFASALVILVLASLFTFLYRFLKKGRKSTEKIVLDWNLIIDNIEGDTSLSEKQIESEILKLLKLYIYEERGVDVSGLLDRELLEKVKMSEILKETSIKSLEDFLINSGKIRFANEPFESASKSSRVNSYRSNQRIRIVKELINEMELGKGDRL